MVVDNHIHNDHEDILQKRMSALYSEDKNKTIRKSHENPYIKNYMKNS